MMIEEAEMIQRYLPMHYNCEPLTNGVRCVSSEGMTQERWEHFNSMLKEIFGTRLANINDQGVNQSHNLFVVLLKKP